MRTRIPPASIAGAQAAVEAWRRDPTPTGGCLEEPFPTFDVADGIDRAAHDAGGGTAADLCSATVERSDTTKEQG